MEGRYHVDGELLKSYRLERKWNQVKCASKLGIATGTYRKAEKDGEGKLTLSTIKQISQKTGIELSALKRKNQRVMTKEEKSQMILATRREEIINLERRGICPSAMDGLILPWETSEKEGLPYDNIEVKSSWEPDGTEESISHLPEVDDTFRKYIERYLEKVESKYGKPNNPKVWLKNFSTPFTDRDTTLKLELGRTDFFTTKCLEMAFDEGGLLEEYENRTFDVEQDLPGLVAVMPVIITKDDHLIMAQRATRAEELAFAGGVWSATGAEQWDPLKDSLPHETVLRCLDEEFNLNPSHNVHVSPDNMKLHAIGREWGDFYNTVFIYVVRVPISGEGALACWRDVTAPAKDKNEHVSVAAVPLREKGVTFLLDLIRMERSEKLSASRLQTACGIEKVVGIPSDGELFPTFGRAGIIKALLAEDFF